MAKIYAYADQSQIQRFHEYAAGVGLNAASLLRLLLVRRLRLPNSASSEWPQSSVIRVRAKIPVDLPPPLLVALSRYAAARERSAGEIAADEVLRELKTRSLERFLLIK